MRNPREDSVPFSVALTRRSGALLLLTLLVAAVLALPYLDALGFIVRGGRPAGGGRGGGGGRARGPPPTVKAGVAHGGGVLHR